MARKLRLEYAGAMYHVINRGNYRFDIFATAGAKNAFETCLFEACAKARWRLQDWLKWSRGIGSRRVCRKAEVESRRGSKRNRNPGRNREARTLSGVGALLAGARRGRSNARVGVGKQRPYRDGFDGGSEKGSNPNNCD